MYSAPDGETLALTCGIWIVWPSASYPWPQMACQEAGVRAMYRILETPPMTGFNGRDRYPIDLADDAALEALIRGRADTVYHPVGTARMGSDADAVVDPRLRVRGVAGLYIADAAVMPRLVGGNTNAPSIMIGERCADFVREDLG